MWRLIFKAGKALLTDSSTVAKGATVLSEHTSKKAGQAALNKVQSVPVKKVPEARTGSKYTGEGKGDPRWENAPFVSKEKFLAQQKAKSAFLKKERDKASKLLVRQTGKTIVKKLGGKVKNKAKKSYTKKARS